MVKVLYTACLPMRGWVGVALAARRAGPGRARRAWLTGLGLLLLVCRGDAPLPRRQGKGGRGGSAWPGGGKSFWREMCANGIVGGRQRMRHVSAGYIRRSSPPYPSPSPLSPSSLRPLARRGSVSIPFVELTRPAAPPRRPAPPRAGPPEIAGLHTPHCTLHKRRAPVATDVQPLP